MALAIVQLTFGSVPLTGEQSFLFPCESGEKATLIKVRCLPLFALAVRSGMPEVPTLEC